jgi:general secretion pathway protein D
MAPPHDSTPPPDRRRSCRRPATLALAVLLAATLAAAPQSRAADDPVTLNFTHADIEAVVKAVSEITGKSFIVDPRV